MSFIRYLSQYFFTVNFFIIATFCPVCVESMTPEMQEARHIRIEEVKRRLEDLPVLIRTWGDAARDYDRAHGVRYDNKPDCRESNWDERHQAAYIKTIKDLIQGVEKGASSEEQFAVIVNAAKNDELGVNVLSRANEMGDGIVMRFILHDAGLALSELMQLLRLRLYYSGGTTLSNAFRIALVRIRDKGEAKEVCLGRITNMIDMVLSHPLLNAPENKNQFLSLLCDRGSRGGTLLHLIAIMSGNWNDIKKLAVKVLDLGGRDKFLAWVNTPRDTVVYEVSDFVDNMVFGAATAAYIERGLHNNYGIMDNLSNPVKLLAEWEARNGRKSQQKKYQDNYQEDALLKASIGSHKDNILQLSKNFELLETNAERVFELGGE